MDTKILEYIVAIAQEKSVNRAAERFLLSHQVMYRHLRNIEKDLGAPIFTKSAKGLLLTQAGAIFLNDAQAILRSETELDAELSSMRYRKKKHIRIGVDTHFQNPFAQRVLPRFHSLHPDFTLEMSVCNAAQARRLLLDGRADLALFDSFTTYSSELEYFVCSSMEMFLAFPKDYAGPADIAGLKAAMNMGMFMTLFPVGTTVRAMEEQQLADHQIYPEFILEGAASSSIAHISNGSTCGILPAVSLTPEIRARLQVGERFYTAYSVIAYPFKSALSSAIQELVEIIIKECGYPF